MDLTTLFIVSTLFLLSLFILILIIRYSNKKIIGQITELRDDLKKISELTKKAEGGIKEKRALMRKIKSVEKELAQFIKKES